MAQIKVPIVLDHDDLQRMVDEKIAELKAQFIPKADYEARLKADLKAILVELQLGIEELDSRAGYDGNGMPTFSTDYIRKKKVNELIQQRINAWEGNNEQREKETPENI